MLLDPGSTGEVRPLFGDDHAFSGTFVERTPHEHIRYTDRFDDPGLPGEMQVTVTLRPVACGTDLSIVQAWRQCVTLTGAEQRASSIRGLLDTDGARRTG